MGKLSAIKSLEHKLPEPLLDARTARSTIYRKHVNIL